MNKKELIQIIDKLESKFAEISKIDEPTDDFKEWKLLFNDGSDKNKDSGARIVHTIMNK